jgi:hypothetical protein
MKRSSWLNLNGRWQYEQGQAGQTPPFRQQLAETVLVPFPVQSPLSGIERGDVRGWYRRDFTVPADWRSQHVLLNFGAVSWGASVYVNGRLAGTHRGDYGSFSFDITRLVHRGANELLVGFSNPMGRAGEPVGKQNPAGPYGIFHTASSGIWQTVWLEPVAAQHFTNLDLTPDVPGKRLIVSAATARRGGQVVAEALNGNAVVSRASAPVGQPLALPIPRPRLWSPSHPHLYGLRLRLISRDRVVDQVQSYYGMRSITLGRVDGVTRILLNGRFLFQTGALDQGYWPDGLYTAPGDAALRYDISAAKLLGYNMLREHAKVEPDRWYYWADKLGILVWQDMPSMAPGTVPVASRQAEFRRELRAMVTQRRSHPSIATWILFNEGWGQFDLPRLTAEVRRLDPSRLIDSQSGGSNCCQAVESPNSDIRDAHLYYGPFAVPPDGRASVIGEYGGVIPIPPLAHRWPGPLTSIGNPVQFWPLGSILSVLRKQYAELAQEMQVRGLSASVFTEFGSYEQELGILSYDRRLFTMPPGLVRGLNDSLIGASAHLAHLRAQPVAVPRGTSGLWRFDEGRGTLATDASGHGHPLYLQGGASWTRGMHSGGLAITGPGQVAVSSTPLVNTSASFTVSAWLNSSLPRQSGSAVSQPGTDGSSFSLGIDSTPAGHPARDGSAATAKPLIGRRTWWTFLVPASPTCPASQCPVWANMHYDDGRYSPRPHSWHYVTGVYDASTQTTSVYVDGVPEDVERVTGIPAPRGPLTVGAGVGNYQPTDMFLGAIDDVRTYGRALSPAEVWQLYWAEAQAPSVRRAS